MLLPWLTFGAGRIRLSKWLASAKHSKHNHYAFKMALGVMLLSLPGYLPLGSSGTSCGSDIYLG